MLVELGTVTMAARVVLEGGLTEVLAAVATTVVVVVAEARASLLLAPA